MKIFVGVMLTAIALFVGCTSVRHGDTGRIAGEEMVILAYSGMPESLTHRAVQDADQKLCSGLRPKTSLPSSALAEIVASARASMKYPSSGRLAGDWKIGEQLAANGAGMRVREGRVEPTKENGALCINCHALDPKEVNVGTLGPSLTGYAVQRGNSEAVIKYTYEKIYNSWAYYPCSIMPRLGHNGYLTAEQIAHVVAYLVDQQSPVNEK